MEGLRNINSRLELFVDDWLIEEMNGVSLQMHNPIPQEVVLEFNQPWEGSISYDPVVMQEGDCYRLWYRGCGSESTWEDQCTAYAESTDGVHWERPTLGIFEFNGNRENNIVLQGSEAKALCVFKDGNLNASDSERYKAVGVGPPIDKRATLRGFTSPDGVHWQTLDQDPILIAPDDPWPMFDSHNVAFWDTMQNRYVTYARGWIPPGIRSIRRSVSDNFRHWSDLEFIDLGNSPTEHLYKNACTQYFRAPHIYLMFPKRFVPDRKFDKDWPASGLSESVFMTSRDGVHWDRRFMEPFLSLGSDPDSWTDRNLYVGVGVVPTGSAEMSVYFMEHYRRPSIRLRRGVLRTDGFVSVNAPYAGGEFLTKPLIFEGDKLVVNYATSVAGGLRVEIQDTEGQPIDGYRLAECVEIFGDEIERVVRWENGSDVGSLAGRAVRLRFVMAAADLYAIQFRA
ncbi:hypothetical protein J4G02_09175 [Candidatus Poribacteria bacterium]|nr:hypothetical protein [Candidatus Poribacteria bacterium]